MKSKFKSVLCSIIFLASLTGCRIQEPHVHSEVTRYDDSYHWNICEICNEITSTKVEHNFKEETIKNPTCTEKGEKKLKCECGYEKNIEVDATGHKFNKNYEFDENYHFHKCLDCGEKKDIESHDLNEEIIDEPTPISEGKKRIYCNNCNYEKEEILNKLPLVETTIEILPDEVNEHPYLEMNGVYLNETYPTEFTIEKNGGYIKSDKIGTIAEISVHLYGYYNNLKIYDDISDGNLLTGEKTYLTDGDNSGYLYTYTLNDSASFRIENPSNYDTNAYFIKIKHTGYVEEPKYEKISIEKALEIGASLTGIDENKYIIKGTVTSIDNNYITLSDGSKSIVVENKSIKKNLNPDYFVELKGKIENRNGQILFVNPSLISYKAATYTVEVQSSQNGSIQLNKYSNINFEEKINVTILPDEGYKIKYLFLNGQKQNFYDNKSSLLITQDSIITAVFVKDYGQNTIESEYVFSSYEEGEDKKYQEEHKLDSNTKITITNSFFSSNLTIYEKGEALIESNGIIKEITLNTNSNSGTLKVYGAEKGKGFIEIKTIELDGSKQYILDISNENYTFIKLVSEKENISFESFSMVYETDDNAEGFVIHSVEMVGTYGDSNLITYKNFDILIDGGTASDSSNVKKVIDTYVLDGVLDLLIITHPDSDHYGGITSGNPFQNLTNINMMITGDHSSNDQIVNNVSSKFPDVEVYNILELVNTEKKIHTLKVDDDFSIDFFWHEGYTLSSKNNQSVATMIKYKNTKLFMAGDMEKAECNRFMPVYPNLTSPEDFVIFKALHHASNGSNETNFIEYIKPDFAFVTAGMKLSDPNKTPNYRAHPYLDASIRIGNYTNKYYWSGICGQLNISCNGYTATAKGLGRSKDYYVYDKNTGNYILADKEKEKDVTYFESYFYQNAVLNMDKPNLANIKLFA